VERKVRILIVEDNNLLRDLFTYGLRKYFHRHGNTSTIDCAPDGSAAWAMLNEATYDLLVIDYYMPCMDGADLVQRLRADPRMQGTSVLAISAGGEDARRALLDAGANVFLDKPLTLKHLAISLDALPCGGAHV
jgi:two-component system, chemotaxis family, sensor histidine kinase and response regulator WspE